MSRKSASRNPKKHDPPRPKLRVYMNPSCWEGVSHLKDNCYDAVFKFKDDIESVESFNASEISYKINSYKHEFGLTNRNVSVIFGYGFSEKEKVYIKDSLKEYARFFLNQIPSHRSQFHM